ncbi:MAG: nucleotidyltransferase domain-containing protein [Nanobdellota archaeon]
MRAEDKIFLAFFEMKKSELYYNQIKEHAGLSHSSLQNALKRLTDSEIFLKEKTKSNTFYCIKDKKYLALKFSEIALSKFRYLNRAVRIPLENLLKDLPRGIYTIILFGSASRKEEAKGSDIDLLVVSESKVVLRKKDAELVSKYPVKIFRCNVREFLENRDDLIIQARETGFPIHKEQNFYEIYIDSLNTG